MLNQFAPSYKNIKTGLDSSKPQIIETAVYKDERGYFFEAHKTMQFSRLELPLTFVQDNVSFSKKGVVRGMHYQRYPYGQGKFVRCLKGKIFDVTINLKTGERESYTLSDENNLGLYVPPYYAHGFQALEDSIIYYKCTVAYVKEYDSGFHPMSVGIEWPSEITEISAKDRVLPPWGINA